MSKLAPLSASLAARHAQLEKLRQDMAEAQSEMAAAPSNAAQAAAEQRFNRLAQLHEKLTSIIEFETPQMIHATFGDNALLAASKTSPIKTEIGRGGYGIVYSVAVGPRHFVLKEQATSGLKRYMNIKHEMIISDEVSRDLPRYVTPMVAAELIKTPDGNIKANFLFEYFYGMDMFDYIEKMRAFAISRTEAIVLYKWTMDALDALHTSGYIHRDIKPENLFVEMDPATNKPIKVRLLDFGMTQKYAPGRVYELEGTANFIPYIQPGTALPYTAHYPRTRPFTGNIGAANNLFAVDVTWSIYLAQPGPKPTAKEIRGALVAYGAVPAPSGPTTPNRLVPARFLRTRRAARKTA
jgi:tRNA A-37 threonylcarbamoyl transferase component Bud32